MAGPDAHARRAQLACARRHVRRDRDGARDARRGRHVGARRPGQDRDRKPDRRAADRAGNRHGDRDAAAVLGAVDRSQLLHRAARARRVLPAVYLSADPRASAAHRSAAARRRRRSVGDALGRVPADHAAARAARHRGGRDARVPHVDGRFRDHVFRRRARRDDVADVHLRRAQVRAHAEDQRDIDDHARAIRDRGDRRQRVGPLRCNR
ncbi:putative aBC transporter, permease protein [Burkholderia pseudomallei A79D]|nr:putative aBC transporter, permease protein [Burkholderia pseudomallei A79D]KGX97341.1 putative aBC transporter, permease protein [Burkholderia pseudomallei A79C]